MTTELKKKPEKKKRMSLRDHLKISSRYDASSMTRVFDVEIDDDAKNDNLKDLARVNEIEWKDSGRKNRRSKQALMCFVCILVIAGIVTSVVLLVVGKNDNGSDAAPSDISAICSPKAVLTAVGYNECQSACAQAECCRRPDDDPLSCAEEKADECEIYNTHCAVLSFDHDKDGKVEVQESVVVPPADPIIEQSCQWDKIDSPQEFVACEDACEPGSCCYEEIETCKVTNPEMCSGYEPCEILHIQNMVTIPPALSDIADLCAAESLNAPDEYNECKAACDPGQCCVKPIEACKVQNPEMCSGYKPCEILHGTPKTHPTSVESRVVTKCNIGALSNPEGITACEDICKPALCCFPEISDSQNRVNKASNNCNNPENKSWCSQYSACQTLQHVDDGVDSHAEAQAAIEDACSNASPEGLARCSNVCAPARCCFDETQNCFENGMDNLRCSDYDACGILYQNDKDPNTSGNPNPIAIDKNQDSALEVSKHILEMCSEESIATDQGKDECHDLCEDNLCCFASGDDNCLSDHGEMCVVYAGCSTLIDSYDGTIVANPNHDSSDSATGESSSAITNQLLEKCDGDKLETQDGFSECYDMCKKNLCCFSVDQLGNCYMDQPSECDDYAPCGELTLERVPNEKVYTKEDIDEACDPANILTDEGFAQCHLMCSKHLCCLSPESGDTSCVDTMGSGKCQKYQSCSALVGEHREEWTRLSFAGFGLGR